jgi:hypothetical protein
MVAVGTGVSIGVGWTRTVGLELGLAKDSAAMAGTDLGLSELEQAAKTTPSSSTASEVAKSGWIVGRYRRRGSPSIALPHRTEAPARAAFGEPRSSMAVGHHRRTNSVSKYNERAGGVRAATGAKRSCSRDHSSRVRTLFSEATKDELNVHV